MTVCAWVYSFALADQPYLTVITKNPTQTDEWIPAVVGRAIALSGTQLSLRLAPYSHPSTVLTLSPHSGAGDETGLVTILVEGEPSRDVYLFDPNDGSEREAAALRLSEVIRREMLRLNPSQRWASTEVLITRLNRLLDQREELKAAYWKLYGDWRAAEAKIALLESQLAALQAEHNDTPEKKRSPAIVAAVTAAVIAVLGQLGNTVLTDALKDPVEKTAAAAAKVQADCNITITDNRTSPSVTAQTATVQAKGQAATSHIVNP